MKFPDDCEAFAKSLGYDSAQKLLDNAKRLGYDTVRDYLDSEHPDWIDKE